MLEKVYFSFTLISGSSPSGDVMKNIYANVPSLAVVQIDCTLIASTFACSGPTNYSLGPRIYMIFLRVLKFKYSGNVSFVEILLNFSEALVADRLPIWSSSLTYYERL